MLIANIGFIRFITNSRPVMNSKMHYKCRNIEKPYLRSDIYRLKVPDDKVKWEVAWPEYAPQDFTSLAAIDKPWADSNDFKNGKFKWNDVDELINRLSYMGKYNLDKTGRPLNPIGRTGLRGRGVLGRWGPNHAADPIVSRFHYGRLQFVGISRRDSGEWAIPGGMVDAGEDVRETLKREFMEEALGGKKYPELDMFWRKGAGDDAIKLRWITVSMGEKLYASHEEFINLLAQHHSGLVIFIVADQSSIVMLSAIYRYIVTLCIVDVAGCGSVLWGLLPLL
ncbi:hypothetical protein DINM_005583 [Dirofilaria immitis]|nr:hypothetical protein [Dirofilaria immitis]